MGTSTPCERPSRTLADQFSLSADERRELLPSGRQATFDNRVGRARTYLKKAGLLESPQRGRFKVTSRGLEVLEQNPQEINVKFLEQYPEFVEFRTKRSVQDEQLDKVTVPVPTQTTPIEVIEAAYQAIRGDLANCWSKLCRVRLASLSAWWSIC
jgi:restriction system protein